MQSLTVKLSLFAKADPNSPHTVASEEPSAYFDFRVLLCRTYTILQPCEGVLPQKRLKDRWSKIHFFNVVVIHKYVAFTAERLHRQPPPANGYSLTR